MISIEDLKPEDESDAAGGREDLKFPVIRKIHNEEIHLGVPAGPSNIQTQLSYLNAVSSEFLKERMENSLIQKRCQVSLKLRMKEEASNGMLLMNRAVSKKNSKVRCSMDASRIVFIGLWISTFVISGLALILL